MTSDWINLGLTVKPLLSGYQIRPNLRGSLRWFKVLAVTGGFVVAGTGVFGAALPPTDIHVVRSLYIATNGVDSNPGTLDQPLGTLEGAREAVRGLRRSGVLTSNSCTVWIRQGTYYRSNTFTLGEQDSGTEQLPVVYRALANETVVFTGAKAITTFAALTNAGILSRLTAAAQTNVLVADISGLGTLDYGSLTNRGALTGRTYISFMRPWMVELFFDGHRQQLARWPNQDKSQEVWVYTTSPVPGAWHEERTDNWFTYRETNPSHWALTETVWVHGMWTYWWDDSYAQITSINTASNIITTDFPGDNGFSANQPYEALNALEELDQPGEWVIDRAQNRVYFWPPATNANQRTTLSVLAPDFMTLSNASSIQFQDLVFDSGRASGISMRYSTNILIAGCTFQNLGNIGVVVGNSIYTNSADKLPVTYDFMGGLSNQVVGCYFHDLGEGGIVLSGGDRLSLQPSGHAARNNYIHDFNTNIRCYRPAIRLDGVGATVSHAVIHDSPHQAIWFGGNDHVIEYCNIYRVCKDSDDAGVIYAVANDWKQQGTVLRYNLIQPSRGHGIYLDDFTSGVTVQGNIIMDVLYPILIGGGRGNKVFNNLVFGYSSVGWTVSNRGTTWATSSIAALVTGLQAVNYTTGPYSKYPEMAQLSIDINQYQSSPSATNFYELGMAKDNQIVTNLFIAANPYVYEIDTNRIAQTGNLYWYSPIVFSNFTAGVTVSAMAARNFRFQTNGAQIPAGFQSIPQSQIGVFNDPSGVVTPAALPTYPPVLPRAPFKGQPLPIPGIIQVEDYDDGPQANAYSSIPARASAFNSSLGDYGNNAWGSGRYRLEAPFYIWGTLTNGTRQYTMDMYYPPAWLEYTVNVAQAGAYNLTFVYTSMTGSFHLELDGAQLTPGMTGTNPTATVTLPQGIHILRLVCDGSGANRLDCITFQRLP
jgi:hypothetical protein